MDIKLGEQLSSSQVVDKFRNKWEGILVRNGPLVKLSIVLYWSEFPSFFFDEEETASIRRVGSANPIETKIPFKELFLFLFLSRC